MVPECDDVIYWRSELWDKVYMAAPKQLRQCVERYKIVNVPALRIAGHNLMQGCSALKSITFPSLQTVGVCCLANCNNRPVAEVANCPKV